MKVAGPPVGAVGPFGPIQVVPPGLTGLLQLKQSGRLPDKLADVVAGVIELRDWYFTARRVNEQALFGGTPTAALPNLTPIGFKFFTIAGANAIVPNGQIWYVEEMSVAVQPTAAQVATDLIRFAGGLEGLVAGVFQQTTNDVSDYQLAARSREAWCKADRGFWAFPGDIFTIRLWDILTTNGYTASLGIRATVCQL